MPTLITVLSLESVKLIPDGFFVSEIDTPLYVYEHSVIPAAFNGIADFQRTPFRTLFVININVKACCLALDSSLPILKLRNGEFSLSVRRKQRIALAVAGDGQGCRSLRRKTEGIGAVAQPGNTDSGMNAIL